MNHVSQKYQWKIGLLLDDSSKCGSTSPPFDPPLWPNGFNYSTFTKLFRQSTEASSIAVGWITKKTKGRFPLLMVRKVWPEVGSRFYDTNTNIHCHESPFQHDYVTSTSCARNGRKLQSGILSTFSSHETGDSTYRGYWQISHWQNGQAYRVANILPTINYPNKVIKLPAIKRNRSPRVK